MANPAAHEVRNCVVGNLRRTVRIVDRLYAEAMDECGVGRAQFSLLNMIEARGEIEVGTLCAEMAVERSALFRQLKPLEERGWVLRQRAADDARRVVLALSAEGKSALESLRARWRTAQANVLDQFGEARWAKLLKELRALQQAVRP